MAPPLFGGFGFDRLLEAGCDEPRQPESASVLRRGNLDTGLPAGDGRERLQDSVPDERQGVGHRASSKYGIQLSGGFQSNAGYPNRSLTTTRTGIDGRNTGGTSWLLSSTTTYRR